MRAVQSRSPFSSVTTISCDAMVLPSRMAVATPVTSPELADLWCVALMSTPTALRPGPAWITAAHEPNASAKATDAPPCSSPNDWRLPSTGIVATTRCADCSRMRTPIFSSSSPSSIVHPLPVSSSTMRPAYVPAGSALRGGIR